MNKASPIILLVPFLIIAAAVGIGVRLNRGKPKEVDPSELVQKAPLASQGISPGEKVQGLGTPHRADGTSILAKYGLQVDEVVAWSSLNCVGGEQDFDGFWGHMMSSVKDENGKTWASVHGWSGQKYVVGIAGGYSRVPKKLVATLLVDNKVFATLDFPPLPTPVAVPHPPLVPAWKGLVVQPCSLVNADMGWGLFHIDSPLEPGHILGATLCGTTYSKESMDLYVVLQGPDTVKYEPTCTFMMNHPETDAKAYVEVVDNAPLHVHKQIRLTGIQPTEQFGLLWFTSSSHPVEVAKGVYVRLNGADKIPFRAPKRGRTHVDVTFETSGLIQHLKAKLISPVTLRSIPVSSKTAMYSQGDFSINSTGPNWNSGPLDFVIDVEADVYKTVRNATVEVDMSKASPYHSPGGFPRNDLRKLYYFNKGYGMHFANFSGTPTASGK